MLKFLAELRKCVTWNNVLTVCWMCLWQHHDQAPFVFGEDMVGGVTQATIERNTYPHKYKLVQRIPTCSVRVHSLHVLLLMLIRVGHTAVCNLFCVMYADCLLPLFHTLLCFGRRKSMPCVASTNVVWHNYREQFFIAKPFEFCHMAGIRSE